MYTETISVGLFYTVVLLAIYGAVTAGIVIVSMINRCKPKHIEIMLGDKSKVRIWALPLMWVIAMLELPAYILWILLNIVYGWYIYATNRDINYAKYLAYLMGEE